LESVRIDWDSSELLGCAVGWVVIHWNMLELIGTDRRSHLMLREHPQWRR